MDGNHRPEPPKAAPPVEMTAAFLDFLRATLLWKIDGLTDEEVRRPMVPSGSCLLGAVKHSGWVERWWFQRVFAGDDVEIIWQGDDPNADWTIEPHETTAEVIAFYEAETARSREIIRGRNWDDLANSTSQGHTLGWIMTHMVEEVARHCGHADIFREMIDGKTGE
jgi:hypothetical protein